MKVALRFPLLAIAIGSLLLGGWLGLVRMGWLLPFVAKPVDHGPLMICGFLGTLIAVERAVALQRWWGYVGPALSAAGAVALLAGIPAASQVLFVLAGLGLVIAFVVIVRQHTASYTLTMGLGAVCWLAGSSLWMAGWSIPRLAAWWAAFLVLTVAGERLELSRVKRLPNWSRHLFSGIVAWLLLGLLAASIWPDTGIRLLGTAYILLGGWLLSFDLARWTIRSDGMPRYIAACLLAGYIWLAAAGVMMIGFGSRLAGVQYDAMLHAVLVGFTISMIFGHAPIILPAILGREIRYHPVLYAPLVLLQVSISLRIAGDLAGWLAGRQWGGLLHGIAILGLLLTLAARNSPGNQQAA